MESCYGDGEGKAYHKWGLVKEHKIAQKKAGNSRVEGVDEGWRAAKGEQGSRTRRVHESNIATRPL